jgi:uncharacterized repeat protein (TIGR03803 family)
VPGCDGQHRASQADNVKGPQEGFMRAKAQRSLRRVRKIATLKTSLSAAALFTLFYIAQSASAQTFTVLYAFKGGTDGDAPFGAIVRDNAGNLYGTTEAGGADLIGTVFKVTNAGDETLLHSFSGFPTDGSEPTGGLVQGGGEFYGTASGGGANDAGAVFKMSASGSESLVYSFAYYPTDGSYPTGGLIRDSAGNLYGTTSQGGELNEGIVFKIDSSGEETVLHSFAGYPTDGAGSYYGSLARDGAGNLYGATGGGGAFGLGTVFKLTPAGVETILHSFTGSTDGSGPTGGLILDTKGNLYGTTSAGGSGGGTECVFGGCGIAFEISPAGKLTILHDFTGSPSDGAGPYANLVMDASGNLYGTTLIGGTFGNGTVFKIDTSHNESILHSFDESTDGAEPFGPVTLDSKGNIYGTASYGGASGAGTVFMITP